MWARASRNRSRTAELSAGRCLGSIPARGVADWSSERSARDVLGDLRSSGEVHTGRGPQRGSRVEQEEALGLLPRLRSLERSSGSGPGEEGNSGTSGMQEWTAQTPRGSDDADEAGGRRGVAGTGRLGLGNQRRRVRGQARGREETRMMR